MVSRLPNAPATPKLFVFNPSPCWPGIWAQSLAQPTSLSHQMLQLQSKLFKFRAWSKQFRITLPLLCINYQINHSAERSLLFPIASPVGLPSKASWNDVSFLRTCGNRSKSGCSVTPKEHFNTAVYFPVLVPTSLYLCDIKLSGFSLLLALKSPINLLIQVPTPHL